jgi:hypothetical protein
MKQFTRAVCAALILAGGVFGTLPASAATLAEYEANRVLNGMAVARNAGITG